MPVLGPILRGTEIITQLPKFQDFPRYLKLKLINEVGEQYALKILLYRVYPAT